jgi:hypothetical protein
VTGGAGTLTMLRAILAVVIALVAALSALPAAAQSADRQQHESGDAFYYRGTGGVPPV